MATIRLPASNQTGRLKVRFTVLCQVIGLTQVQTTRLPCRFIESIRFVGILARLIEAFGPCEGISRTEGRLLGQLFGPENVGCSTVSSDRQILSAILSNFVLRASAAVAAKDTIKSKD
jgi:hypothetical protein